MRKADLLIIAAALAAFLIGILFSESGTTAQVYVDGKLYSELSLDKETVLEINEGTAKNTVVIENKSIYITNSNCPDKLCEKQKIRKTGQSLICLPNKVCIVIKGGKSETDVVL